MRHCGLVVVLLALCGCQTLSSGGDAQNAGEPAAADGKCDASRLQDHIGHTATEASGAKLLELSGAQTLRWGPPNAAWTMDYREDRLNVRYDEAMKITAITCG